MMSRFQRLTGLFLAVAMTWTGALLAADNPTHREGKFAGDDGLELYEQSWHPAGETKAVLVVVHGLKDHSTRYATAAAAWTQKGIAVYAFDLRGHGKSQGDRVWVNSFDEYLKDLKTFLARVQNQETGKSIFLFGHSMGGAIVTLYTLNEKPDLRGLILSGAALKLPANIDLTQLALINKFSKTVPHFPVLKLEGKNFSHDPQVVAENDRTDPLIYHLPGPARTAAELFRAVGEIQESMEAVTLPLLILHGEDDHVTDPLGSQQLSERAGSKDKTLKLYPHLFHDITHEPGNTVARDIADWIENRLPKR